MEEPKRGAEEPSAIAPPKVWLLLGERKGDNAQVLALGEALGWPYEVKELHFDPDCPTPFHKRGASLIGLDLARSSPLSAPWPDLVLAIGRRSASVSRWIKASTGGDAMTVHLGRPRVAFHHFDLIFSTPQYGLPPGANVVRLDFPITLNREAALSRAADEWEPKWAHLPRPWVAVFLGGPTAQLRFDGEVGAELRTKLEAFLAGKGSLLIATSPRTSAEVADQMQAGIEPPHCLFRWSPTEANPYHALLKLADEFVVTSDSVSMLADSVDRMKPLFVFELPRRVRPGWRGLVTSARRYLPLRRQRRQMAGLKADLLDVVYDGLTRLGQARPRRQTAAFCQRLYQLGLARPLATGRAGQDGWTSRRILEEERNRAVERIRETYASRSRSRAADPDGATPASCPSPR